MASESEESLASQSSEIAMLKQTFDGQVRVIGSVGEYSNVVNIVPRDLDLQCKFQLSSTYPTTRPTLIVTSKSVAKEHLNDLTTALDIFITTRKGQNLMAETIGFCLAWLKKNNVDAQLAKPQEKKTSKSKYSKKKETKKQPKDEDEVILEKKPPMKTAADVIKRIQWDEGIDKEQFIVGYLDRLTGLEEKPFTAFTWEDLASVDMFCLAIPQHRIQFFKYKDEKVWDKNVRLDNVFGSTGSKQTIVETVEKYEDRQRKLEAKRREENASGSDEERDDFDNFDDGVEVNIDVNDEGETIDDESFSETSDQCATGVSENESRKRPNFFITLQITNPETIKNLTDAQASFMKTCPQYEAHQVLPCSFHLTLAVLRLDSTAEKTKCVENMNKLVPDIVKLAKQSKSISFVGLDHFSAKVVYAKVNYPREIRDIADHLASSLQASGIDISANFTPHLTLFKVSRSDSKKERGLFETNNIATHLMSYADKEFGVQEIDNIQVCEMGSLQADSFYRNIVKIDIRHTS